MKEKRKLRDKMALNMIKPGDALEVTNDMELFNLKQIKKKYVSTRMHSSRMRTVRCSGCRGGGCLPLCPVRCTPPRQTPPSQADIPPPNEQNS